MPAASEAAARRVHPLVYVDYRIRLAAVAIVALIMGSVFWERGVSGGWLAFNDPVPLLNPAERAVRTAVAIRDRVHELAAGWRKQGWELALGAGIAQGYATLGAIGFEGRWDYAAIGTVTNLAARLCAEAQPGDILVTARVHAAVEAGVEADLLTPLTLKGFQRPVPAVRVTALRA